MITWYCYLWISCSPVLYDGSTRQNYDWAAAAVVWVRVDAAFPCPSAFLFLMLAVSKICGIGMASVDPAAVPAVARSLASPLWLSPGGRRGPPPIYLLPKFLPGIRALPLSPERGRPNGPATCGSTWVMATGSKQYTQSSTWNGLGCPEYCLAVASNTTVCFFVISWISCC